MFGLVETMFRV